ncbi:MAG: hypothetical protein SFW35_10005 [Chitinophagales bacterium]|nr:hypothetical protein [Chitinophagales bacterium]
MKKSLLVLATILSFVLFFSQKAAASHAMGADISYQCIGQDSFLVTLNFYRDCNGIAAPTTASISVRSITCNITQTVTLTQPSLIQPQGIPNGSEVSALCGNQLGNSACNGGSLPGVQQYQYTGLVVLPQQCTDWTFGYDLNARNAQVDNLVNPGSVDLYVEATLNNTVPGACNNSPVFTNRPVPYFCFLDSILYNHGTIDVDGDSLVYSLIQPLQDPGTVVPYAAGFSVANPITTNGGLFFDTQTGQLQFVPSQAQEVVVTILVQEYRNGVLIGTTMRDIQVVILGTPLCNPPYGVIINNGITPSSVQGGSLTGPFDIEACPGDTVRWCITYIGDSIYLTSNAAGIGATFDTTRIGLDTVIGCFRWVPTAVDTGFNVFSLNYGINSCPIDRTSSRTVTIAILDGTDAGPDRTYCPGGVPVQLFAVGGNVFTWTPSTGLSDPSIRNPLATPSVTTDYIVTSDLSARCKNRDTVRISLVPNFLWELQPIDDTIDVCRNEAIQLSAVVDPLYAPYTYEWTPVDSLSDSTAAAPFVNPIRTTTYTVVVTSDTGCVVSDSITINVTGVGPKVVISASDEEVCPGDTVTLTGNVYPLSCAPSIGSGECGPGNTPVPRTFGSGSTTAAVTPLGGSNAAYRYQVLYRASDLRAAGYTAGTITRMQMTVANKLSTGVYTNLTIKIGCTNAVDLSRSAWQTGTSQVFFSSAYLTSIGPNNFNFQSPYDWDGVSNLIVEFCFGGGAAPGGNDGVLSTNVGYAAAMSATSASTTDGCVLPASLIPTTQPIQSVPNITMSICGARPRTYTYQWSPTSGLTNPTGAVTQTAVTQQVTYSLSVADSLCSGTDFQTLTIDTTSISVTPDTALCTADSVQLLVDVRTSLPANCGINGNTCAGPLAFQQIGTGTIQNFDDEYPSPYGNFYESAMQQYLYSAADLRAQGLTPGRIREIAFFVAQVQGTATYRNFSIKAKCTNTPALVGGSPETGVSTVFNSRTINIVSGWNNHVLDNAFDWDGSSNILLEVCFNNNLGASIDWTSNSTVNSSITGYVSSAWYPVDDDNACLNPLNSDPFAQGFGNIRPNTRFRSCAQPLPYTVRWSPGNTLSDSTSVSPIAFPTTPTTYRVSVVTPSGCTKVDSVTVSVGSLPYTLSNDTAVCPGQTVQLSASGGNTYQWSPTAGLSCTTCPNPVVTVDSLVEYFVTITDTSIGCSITDSVTLSLLQTPPAPFGNDTFICLTDSIVLDAGMGFISYQWSVQGNFGQTLTVFAAGQYSVTVTAPNGCVIADTIEIGIRAAPPVNIGRDTILCEGDTVILNAGLGYTSYLWSNSDTDDTTTITTSGIYSVTVTDANACPSSDTMVAIFNTVPVVNLGADTVLCFGDTLRLVANNSAGYIYLWNDGITTDSVLNLTAAYPFDTVIVTVFGGGALCSVTDTIVVEFRDSIEFSLGNDTVICNGGPIVLDATNDFSSFIWSPGGAITQTLVLTSGGTYSVTVTDPFGCTASDTIVVNDTTPVIDLGPDQFACIGDTISLSTGGGFATYVWLPGGETTPIIDVTANGTYSITVTNGLGCFASDTVSVTFLTFPVVDLGPDTSICQGASLILDAGNVGATYVWQDSSQGQTFQVTAPGEYSVTVTNQGGCSTADTIVVDFLPSPVVNLGPDTTVCAGTSVTFDAGQGFVSYAWSGPIVSNQQSITVSTPGVYTVVVTDTNGCTGTDVVALANSSVLVNLGPDRGLCSTGSLTLDAGAGYTSYNWSPGGETTRTIIVTAPGTYCVTVVDPAGCSGTDCVTITANGGPQPNLGADVTICPGESYTLYPGAFAAYDWSDNTTNSTLTVNVSGTYSVTVTDSLGCIGADTATVTVLPDIPALNLTDTLICLNGTATITAPAGFSSYFWSDSSTSQTFVTSTPGTYSLTVTTVDGCTATDVVEVGDGSLDLIVSADPSQVNAGGTTQLQVQVNPSGTYNFAWTPSTSLSDSTIANPVATPTANTTYVVTVTDPATTCSTIDSVTVSVFDSCIYSFPEAFTPFNGGANNSFFLITNGCPNVRVVEFKVYNRWGQLIHSSPVPWNGTVGGVQQPEDAYVFSAVIEITTATGVRTVTYNSTVTLLR